MTPAAILFSRKRKSRRAFEVWLARAAQARRIALMVPPADAKILEAYASECESQAQSSIAALPPQAA
jgi:hypothetical protein